MSDSTTPSTTPSGDDLSSPGNQSIPGDRSLDEFEGSLGLPDKCPISVETEATRLLLLEPSEVRALTCQECGEGAYVLEQFSLFIQRATNREQARVHRSEELLRKLLPSLLRDRREYMLDEKKMMAIAESPRAIELERLRVEAVLRLDRLAYMAARISSVSKLLLNLQQTKGAKT